MNTIIIHGTEELAILVPRLIEEGVRFKAYPQQNDAGVTSYIVEVGEYVKRK